MSVTTVRVGIVQEIAETGRCGANLDRLHRAVSAAAQQGAEVVVSPELFATGYDPATAWTHDGERVRARLGQIARSEGVALVASSVDTEGAATPRPEHRIAASFFTPEGEELTRIHKRHLFGPEERRHFVPGRGYSEPVLWRGIRWGLGICYDVEFPEFGRDQARRGAQVLLIPTAVPVVADPGPDGIQTPAAERYDARVISTLQVPVRALENGLYVAYANHAGPAFTGHSCVATPAGRPAVLMEHAEPGVAVVEVSTAFTEHARRTNTYLEDLGR